jgi:hypothetical protein
VDSTRHLSPLEAQRIIEDPLIVSVDLLKPELRREVLVNLLRTLDTPSGLALVFLLGALTSRSLVRRLGRRLANPQWASFQSFRTWYIGSGPVRRWSVAAAALVVGIIIFLLTRDFVLPALDFVIPKLGFAIFVILLDPTYWLAIAFFLMALFAIEIIALIVRHLTRKIPPPLPASF